MAQHYVPRFYLRHFTFDSDKSQVFSMDKNFTIHDKSSPISKICAKKNYNTPQQEQEQSNLEKSDSEILREFVNSPNPGAYNRSREFVEFVGFLLANNIYVREAMTKTISQMLEEDLGSEFDGNVSVDIGYRSRLDLSLAFADCVFEEFKNWMFVRHGPTNAEKVYITSDNPVSIFNPEDVFAPWETTAQLKDLNINFGNQSRRISENGMSKETKITFTLDGVSFGKDVVMIFPITPSVCLLGFSNKTRHLKFMNRRQPNNNDILGFMNLVTFSQCNKVVYSHSKGILEVTKSDMPKFREHCERHGYAPSFDVGIA